MGIAVLEGTRGFVVASVTVYDQNAGQRFFSQDHLGNFGGAGFPEEKQTDLLCGEEPNVAILPIGSPTGFIGVFDRGLSILLHQRGNNWREQTSQTMKGFYETSWIDMQLFADPA
jgi:hypothetical protein